MNNNKKTVKRKEFKYFFSACFALVGLVSIFALIMVFKIAEVSGGAGVGIGMAWTVFLMITLAIIAEVEAGTPSLQQSKPGTQRTQQRKTMTGIDIQYYATNNIKKLGGN